MIRYNEQRNGRQSPDLKSDDPNEKENSHDIQR